MTEELHERYTEAKAQAQEFLSVEAPAQEKVLNISAEKSVL